MGGERQGCAIEIYNLSLGHVEKLYSTRNAKLESIGLDERGIVCEEPQDNVSSTELRKRISEALSIALDLGVSGLELSLTLRLFPPTS